MGGCAYYQKQHQLCAIGPLAKLGLIRSQLSRWYVLLYQSWKYNEKQLKMCSSNYPSFDRWRMEMLIIDDGDNGGDQGGRSCGSAVAALPERSWSLRKERSSTYGKNFKTTFWRKNLQILHFCRENTNVHSLKLWGFFGASRKAANFLSTWH